jgi:hypothetical protein
MARLVSPAALTNLGNYEASAELAHLPGGVSLPLLGVASVWRTSENDPSTHSGELRQREEETEGQSCYDPALRRERG